MVGRIGSRFHLLDGQHRLGAAAQAEGSVDPLGLQPGYERLADRLLPAVTVRMGRPRFVTAMAVGACVCEGWDTDAVSADDITPPWLVWEWFVVEAFVRAEESLAGKSGIPGIQKVQRAVRNQRPVSAAAYFKTPASFGFTGVFRRLARGMVRARRCEMNVSEKAGSSWRTLNDSGSLTRSWLLPWRALCCKSGRGLRIESPPVGRFVE